MIDPMLMEKRDPLLGAYLDGLIKRELKILKGMQMSAKVDESGIETQRSAVAELKRLKEETEKW